MSELKLQIDANLKDKKEERFDVMDMYLAAAVLAYGAELDGIDRSDLKRQKFTFINTIPKIYISRGEQSPEVISRPTFPIIENYFIGRNLLYPPNYVDALRRVKSALHSA